MAKQILIKDSKLKDLKPDPDNPRTISEEKLSSLRKSLEEFGDLSCIVYNELEDKLVGAHQRLKVFNPNSKIVITDKYKKPNRQGTIREGYVLIDGEKFKYRVVRWTKEKHKAAMLAANKHSGDWIQNKVDEILYDLKNVGFDISLTGFDINEIFKKQVSFEASEKVEFEYKIEITCKSEKIQKQIYEEMNERGFEVRLLL